MVTPNILYSLDYFVYLFAVLIIFKTLVTDKELFPTLEPWLTFIILIPRPRRTSPIQGQQGPMGGSDARCQRLPDKIWQWRVQPVPEDRRRGGKGALRVHQLSTVHPGQKHHVQYDRWRATVSRMLRYFELSNFNKYKFYWMLGYVLHKI